MLKPTVYAILALSCLLLATVNGENVFKKRGGISGEDFLLIQAAMPEFIANHIDITKYDMLVYERDDIIEVMGADQNKPSTLLGSRKGFPELSVIISRDKHEIISSHYNK